MKKIARSVIQTMANGFDMRLYALMEEADEYAKSDITGGKRGVPIRSWLTGTRTLVRDMMHPSDREDTIG